MKPVEIRSEKSREYPHDHVTKIVAIFPSGHKKVIMNLERRWDVGWRRYYYESDRSRLDWYSTIKEAIEDVSYRIETLLLETL